MLWIATFLTNFRLINDNNELKNRLIRQMLYSVRELYFHVGENLPGPAAMMPVKAAVSMWLGILHLEYQAFRVKWAMDLNIPYSVELCDCAICQPMQNLNYWNGIQQHIGEGCFCGAGNPENAHNIPHEIPHPEPEPEVEPDQRPISRSPPMAPPPTECDISLPATPEVPVIISPVCADGANVIDLYPVPYDPFEDPLPSTSYALQNSTPPEYSNPSSTPTRSISPFDVDNSPYVMERSEDGLRLIIRRNRD